MNLQKIASNVQMICEAIASVVNIDVTIVDQNLVRIGGTGRYKDSIGVHVGLQSAFHYAITEGVAFVIENPGTHQACLSCTCREKCSEHAEMCCPILADGKVVGVIGLIAFTEVQRSALISNQTNLMSFLNRMAEMISAKLKEQERTEAVEMLAKELEVVVDSMNTGFVALDADGKVSRMNAKAKTIFKGYKTEDLSDLLSEKECVRILTEKTTLKNEYYVDVRGHRGIFDSAPILIGGRVKGHVITVKPIQEVINVLNEMTQDVVRTQFSDILGTTDVMWQAKETAQKVAESKSTVLLLGESGTGKELFSRAIHNASTRAHAPFIAINCAAIPDALLESELFGYEEGAFTGAKRGGKPGRFQLAHKGTLFLDEIGDMPLHLQTKLLRVLQESKVMPVGGESMIEVDVRLIAATHRNLEEMVLEGAFRQDLYYRLNVIPIQIPALRERVADLPLLTEHILNKCNDKLYKSVNSVSSDCMEELMAYTWPGNVRELENTLEYAVNMAEGPVIESFHLPKRMVQNFEKTHAHVKREIEPLETLEKRAILEALNYFGNGKAAAIRAAEALGISKAKLYRKLKEYKEN
ncbi:sigma 54-interacting transcriptional regulator [Fusibacter tunisiensis]|uniref:Transcriptional regulator with PAS, ATPase and Fis domain n=1 Tax=Fusibacter tunisiensis TaxID=1008308 RepID=A0ABS2MN37_9FIRM|nr:transcriptional regulator with PAS, ATPase and Fis domain [Fusibacter tunisiensis]